MLILSVRPTKFSILPIRLKTTQSTNHLFFSFIVNITTNQK